MFFQKPCAKRHLLGHERQKPLLDPGKVGYNDQKKFGNEVGSLRLHGLAGRVTQTRRKGFPAVSRREILVQAQRLTWVRWLALVYAAFLLLLGIGLDIAPWLARILARLLLVTAGLNLVLQGFYRQALRKEELTLWDVLPAYFHTASDLLILFTALHYTGGLNSPLDTLLVVYLIGVAMMYPLRAVLGFSLATLMAYGFLAWSYVTGFLPLFSNHGTVLPPPSPRSVLLWAGADGLFILIVVAMVFSMATALRQARAQAEQERTYLDRLHRLLRESLRQGELQKLAQYLADHMGPLVGADGVFITLWDPERELPIPLAAYGEQREEYPRIKVTPADRPNLTESVRRLGRPLVIPDIQNTPYLNPRVAARFPTRAAIVVPMHFHPGEEFLGAAIFSYHTPRHLTPEEVTRAQEITDAMSVVLSRAVTAARLRKEMAILEALLHLSLEMGQQRDPKKLAQMCVEGLCNLLEAQRGACYVLNGEGASKLLVLASHNLSETYLQWVQEAYLTLPGSKAIGFGAVVTISNVEKDERVPAPQRRMALREGIHAYIVASITTPRGPQGGLVLYWDRPRRFQYEEVVAVRLMAAHLGVALSNVRLFDYLQEMALTDPLTGLPNRRAFEEVLERELLRARRYHHPLGLLMLDLDAFKGINDQYGHLVGDQVLRQIATALRRTLRETDFVARYGGDEFIVLLPETGPEQGAVVAERLAQAIEALEYLGVPEGIRCTLSVGMAFYPQDGEDAETLLSVADERLYEAKGKRLSSMEYNNGL